MTQKVLRDALYFFEGICGTLAGSLLRFLGPPGRAFYRSLVVWNRSLGDTTTLHLAPFMTALGTAQFDLGAPTIERLTLPNGPVLKLDLSEKTQRQVFSHKVFEAGLSRFLLRTLKPGDTFIDVGSNVGYFALLAAPCVGASGLVLALEPEKKNFEILQNAVKENNLSQVRPLQIAAADTDGGTMRLNVNPLNRGGNSMIPFSTYKSGRHEESKEAIAEKFSNEELFQEVSVRTLDALCAEHHVASIALMKIDVEGFEMNVLSGARSIFSNKVPKQVVCEMNNEETHGAVLEFFTRNGYVPHRIAFDGSVTPFLKDAHIHGNVLFSAS